VAINYALFSPQIKGETRCRRWNLSRDSKERRRAENASALAKGKMTGGDAIRIYKERVQGRVDLKPLTKAYHSQRIDGLLKSWSALEKADLSKVIAVLRSDFSEVNYDGPARAVEFYPGDAADRERVRQQAVTVGRTLLGT
jgi:hypothetical protein